MNEVHEDATSQGTLPIGQDPFSSITSHGVLEGPALAAPIRITSYKTIIGRRNADVVIDDLDVSRQHAVIERYAERFLVRDLGSTNGTYVNHRKVEAEFLRSGDVIKVGATRLTFRVEPS